MSKRSTQMNVSTPPGPGGICQQVRAMHHMHVVELDSLRIKGEKIIDQDEDAILPPGRSTDIGPAKVNKISSPMKI